MWRKLLRLSPRCDKSGDKSLRHVSGDMMIRTVYYPVPTYQYSIQPAGCCMVICFLLWNVYSISYHGSITEDLRVSMAIIGKQT